MSPLGRLPSIGLAEMNRHAGLMTRFDAKYVLDERALGDLVGALDGRARVLRDGDRDRFRYVTVFFDDPVLRSYRDHAMGRVRRFKTRIRRYEDTGDTFVEAKMRLPRGQTVKQRHMIDCAAIDPTADPTTEMLDFLGATLGEVLGIDLPTGLAPAVVVRFDRTTVVCESSGERITVDSNLVIGTPEGATTCSALPDVHVVEVKSASQRSDIGRILGRGGSHPMAISKYCMGVGLTRPDMRANPWRPAMRLLGLAAAPARGTR